MHKGRDLSLQVLFSSLFDKQLPASLRHVKGFLHEERALQRGSLGDLAPALVFATAGALYWPPGKV